MTAHCRTILERGVGRMISEPSESSFSAAGCHERDAKAKPCQLLHDLETRNFDVGGESHPAAEKEILRPPKGDTVAVVKEKLLLRQIRRRDRVLLRPRMQWREQEIETVAEKRVRLEPCWQLVLNNNGEVCPTLFDLAYRRWAVFKTDNN